MGGDRSERYIYIRRSQPEAQDCIPKSMDPCGGYGGYGGGSRLLKRHPNQSASLFIQLVRFNAAIPMSTATPMSRSRSFITSCRNPQI